MTYIAMSSIFTLTMICGTIPTAHATASRLIATGWDSPTPARFRAELAEFEKWGCFDGTTIAPTLESGDVQAAIEPSTYSLQPAFVDGWCDVMPDTVRIVEGDEDAYLFNSEGEFNRAFTRLKLGAPEFVSPENREKLRVKYAVGHGIYLDAHVNPPTSNWYIDRLGGTSAQRLAENVASALRASDGFVWLYGERAKWWPGGNPNSPMWPEKLQGAVEAIQQARDPIGFAKKILDQSKPEDNSLRNSDFKKLSADGKAEDWWTWEDERSHGKIGIEQNLACLSGVQNGVFGQNINVKPGESYAVRCRIRSIGRGFSCISIGWKTTEGKWTAQNARYHFAPIGKADRDGWREALGWVRVPWEAGQMIFMLSTQGQNTEDDRAWFDKCQAVFF